MGQVRENKIEIIIFIPFNERYYKYKINGLPESYLIEEQKAKEMAIRLLPDRKKEIIEMFTRVQPFMIKIKAKEIIHLVFKREKINKKELIDREFKKFEINPYDSLKIDLFKDIIEKNKKNHLTVNPFLSKFRTVNGR